MKTPEERLWDDVTDAATPSAAEMAAAEAELREFEGAAPLAPEMVAAVIARATAQDAGRFRSVSGHRRLWLLAALLFVSVSVVAAVVLPRVWPEQVMSPRTLDYAEAVRLATEPGRDEEARFHAVLEIDKHCAGVAATLRTLESSPNPELAQESQRLRRGLADLLANEPQAIPGRVDADFRSTIAAALDERRPAEERLGLLPEIHRQAAAGLTAMQQAGSFFSGRTKVSYELIMPRLVRDFADEKKQ